MPTLVTSLTQQSISLQGGFIFRNLILFSPRKCSGAKKPRRRPGFLYKREELSFYLKSALSYELNIRRYGAVYSAVDIAAVARTTSEPEVSIDFASAPPVSPMVISVANPSFAS